MTRIKKAAVIGAGVMGAAIAGHLANAGIRTVLLDIVPKELTEEEKAKGLTLEDRAVRNRIAQTGKDRLFKEKPSPLFHKKVADLIETGNLEDDFEKLGEVDWVIEAIVENLKIKQNLLRGCGKGLETGNHRQFQHLRDLHPGDGGQPFRGIPIPFPRHPLFQSAALYEVIGDHPD